MQPSNYSALEALAQSLVSTRLYERAIDVRTAKAALEALQSQVNEKQRVHREAVASKDFHSAARWWSELVQIQARLTDEVDRVKTDFESELGSPTLYAGVGDAGELARLISSPAADEVDHMIIELARGEERALAAGNLALAVERRDLPKRLVELKDSIAQHCLREQECVQSKDYAGAHDAWREAEAARSAVVSVLAEVTVLAEDHVVPSNMLGPSVHSPPASTSKHKMSVAAMRPSEEGIKELNALIHARSEEFDAEFAAPLDRATTDLNHVECVPVEWSGNVVKNLNAEFDRAAMVLPAQSLGEDTPSVVVVPSFANLPREIIYTMASKLATATARSAMMLTCLEWRAAIEHSDELLWEAIALNEFPRLVSLANHFELSGSWQDHYRAQLVAGRPRMRAHVINSTLAEYMLTIELRWGEFMHEWNGTSDEWKFRGDNVRSHLWDASNRPSWLGYFDDLTDEEQEQCFKRLLDTRLPTLSIFVSRAHGCTLQTVQLATEVVGDADEVSNMVLVFDGADEGLPHCAASDPPGFVRPHLDLRTGAFYWCFRDEEGMDLNAARLLTYFALKVPWPVTLWEA